MMKLLSAHRPAHQLFFWGHRNPFHVCVPVLYSAMISTLCFCSSTKFSHSAHILRYGPLKHDVLRQAITVHVSIVMWRRGRKVLCKCVKRYYISPTISENVIIHFIILATKGTLSQCGTGGEWMCAALLGVIRHQSMHHLWWTNSVELGEIFSRTRVVYL